MNGEHVQHTPSQVCLKFMNSSYQQDCTPFTKPKQALLVTPPAGYVVQHQRAWLMYSLLVLRWPKQSTSQGMTQFLRSCFLTSYKTLDLLKRHHCGIHQLSHSRYMRERIHRHIGTSQSTESTKILGPTELMRE